MNRRKHREEKASADCIICTKGNTNVTTVCCEQPYHLSCLVTWLRKDARHSCPGCRVVISVPAEAAAVEQRGGDDAAEDGNTSGTEADTTADASGTEADTIADASGTEADTIADTSGTEADTTAGATQDGGASGTEEDTTADTPQRTCAACDVCLDGSEYSNNQWSKGDGGSRCKDCVTHRRFR